MIFLERANIKVRANSATEDEFAPRVIVTGIPNSVAVTTSIFVSYTHLDVYKRQT